MNSGPSIYLPATSASALIFWQRPDLMWWERNRRRPHGVVRRKKHSFRRELRAHLHFSQLRHFCSNNISVSPLHLLKSSFSFNKCVFLHFKTRPLHGWLHLAWRIKDDSRGNEQALVVKMLLTAGELWLSSSVLNLLFYIKEPINLSQSMLCRVLFHNWKCFRQIPPIQVRNFFKD